MSGGGIVPKARKKSEILIMYMCEGKNDFRPGKKSRAGRIFLEEIEKYALFGSVAQRSGAEILLHCKVAA